MSFDLAFYPPDSTGSSKGALSKWRSKRGLKKWFSNRENYDVDRDDALYENENTDVHFMVDISQEQ